MANKKTRVTYKGINQDIAKSRAQGDEYFDAWNMKLTPVEGQTFGTISNSYGNILAVTIPRPEIEKDTNTIRYAGKELSYVSSEIDDLPVVSGKQLIIGHVTTTRGAIVFTTDETLDCVWLIPDLDVDTHAVPDMDIELLYIRSMGFSTEFPIQALFNYENEIIQKVYWVDGNNYLRFLNISENVDNGYLHNLIDLPVSSVNSKSTVDISKPTVTSGGGGGTHTAGMVQYANTLYNLNGAETSLSPLSDLFPLDKGVGQGGGEVNEVVGALPIVSIADIDKKYNYLKLYRVKYTEYNGTPEIELVSDGLIGNYDLFTYTDTGTSGLGSVGLAEFLFLGADPIKPTHITTKDNILFASNNKSTTYTIDVDTRAYSFNEDGSKANIYSNVVYDGSTNEIPYNGDRIDVAYKGFDIDPKFDCVNLDYDTYRFIGNQALVSSAPLIDKAIYSGQITTIAPIDEVSGYNLTIPATLTKDCAQINTQLTSVSKEITFPNGTNKYTLTTAADYNVKFFESWILNEVTDKIKVSSIACTIEVYPSQSSNTPDYTTVMRRRATLSGTEYSELLENVSVGQTIKIIADIFYHYDYDTCGFRTVDPNSLINYVGDGKNPIGGAEGDSATVNFEWDIIGMSIQRVTKLNTNTFLPMTATAGETSIVNGEWVADYVGTAKFTFNVTANMNGVTLVDPLIYNIGYFKNGSLVAKQLLGLTTTGVKTFQFIDNNVNIEYGDVISVQLIYNTTSAEYAHQDANVSITGDVTIDRQVVAGFNGEGGTGKYLSYKLTRTNEADLGISLTQARFFKDNEIYRIGVMFYNNIGQSSEAKWIADFKAPEGNLEGQYNTLSVQFNSEFYAHIATLPEEEQPTNYVILRATRNYTDKTIITQGLLTSMFVQDYTSNFESSNTYEKKENKNASLVKTPIPFTRGYGTGVALEDSYYPAFPTNHNMTMNESGQVDPTRTGDQDPSFERVIDEIYRDSSTDRKRQQSWQYTKMIQMYSPETTFHFPVLTTNADELFITGHMIRKNWDRWEFNIDYQSLSPHASNKKSFTEGNPAGFGNYALGSYGVFGPGYRIYKDYQTARPEYAGYDVGSGVKHSARIHLHKTFGDFQKVSSELKYTILNKPEVTETGQGITAYNNDTALQYINSLGLVISDYKRPNDGGADDTPGITSISSENNRCLTMVLGDESEEHRNRVGLDQIYGQVGAGAWDVELFGEVRRNKKYVYSGVLYNGYSYSSRSRTEYITVGPVQDISDYEVNIMSPGDTYVQLFKNTRLTKVDGAAYTKQNMSMVESLEYKVETVVNLHERNDTSLKSWDTIVDPTAAEGSNYNKVYSTDSALQKFVPDNQKIRKVNKAEVEIMASKVKIPGEFVDNWVDFRPNEVMHLDGKYGPINNVENYNDELFAFQDFAVAHISVNPRVQTTAGDGVTIELGAGNVLHDYQYISTKSGCINKWGMYSTNSGLYYLDANNKQIQRIQAKSGVQSVSEAKGLHSYLFKNLDRDVLRNDNPVTGQGVVLGYDTINGDVFTSVIQDGEDFNISFNEKLNSFTSFYSFTPSRFISKGDRFFTTPYEAGDTIWLHDSSNYQSFYGSRYDSTITLMINTDTPGTEKVFNGIEFDSEVTLDGVDIPDVTLDTIKAWTTYQSTGDAPIPLEIGANIKRRFRTWRANIPREYASRNRMRDKWIYIKLGFNPDDNKKLILYDIIVNYNA